MKTAVAFISIIVIFFLDCWKTMSSCIRPRGPIFTAVSFWEGLTAGSINVMDLFLLADYLNGTAVEPYINDLNSQHPFSGRRDSSSFSMSRGFFEVFSKEEILKITNLTHEPVSAGSDFIYLL